MAALQVEPCTDGVALHATNTTCLTACMHAGSPAPALLKDWRFDP